ncbi:MAG: hypothetical protein WCF18_00560 [Chthoniobacteraceae bacterium]
MGAINASRNPRDTIDAVAQALRLAELAGLDAAKVREALLGGFAESRILNLHGHLE